MFKALSLLLMRTLINTVWCSEYIHICLHFRGTEGVSLKRIFIEKDVYLEGDILMRVLNV